MAKHCRPNLLFVLVAAGSVGDQGLTFLRLTQGEDRASALAQEAVEADLRSVDSAGHWRRALEAAPRSAIAGVNLGLALERVGRVQEAERRLLETERMNRLWLPRWTLASFYLRNGRKHEAARWGRLALERSNAEVRPALFALLEEAGVSVREWLGWCGNEAELVGSALQYLGAENRAEDLAAAAAVMASLNPGRAPAFWRDSLHEASSRLLAAGHGEAAVSAWNAITARALLPYGRIDGENLIGNPRFAGPLDGLSFNWRFKSLPGVSRIFRPEAGAARISFDGGQPEQSVLLTAPVWLSRGRRYRFVYRFRTAELTPEDAGPVWKLAGQASPPLRASRNAAGEPWSEAVMEIPAAAESGVQTLILALDRRRGSVRATGIIEISDLRLMTVR